MIYIMHSAGFVKIGHTSKNPFDRLSSIQSCCPSEVSLGLRHRPMRELVPLARRLGVRLHPMGLSKVVDLALRYAEEVSP